jgi:hypothetical protein
MDLMFRDTDRFRPDRSVDWYRADGHVTYGPDYYRQQPATPPGALILEDLAAAVLFVGQPRPRAAQTLARAQPIDITEIAQEPLHTLSATQRQIVACSPYELSVGDVDSVARTRVSEPPLNLFAVTPGLKVKGLR